MRCPLCAGPLREESVNLFTCEVGHQLRGEDLHKAATSRASVSLWMAIEALDSEASALRALAGTTTDDGIDDLADQAERDAQLLRALSTAHVPPGNMRHDGDVPARLGRAVRAVALFLVAEAPLGETLHRIALVARDAGNAKAAGITLLDEHGRPSTRVFTDDLSPRVDQAQYDEGAGPCVDAYREGRMVRVDDTREMVDRWPAYSRRAVEHGVLSTLSLPLAAAGDSFGALNLYAGVERAFSAVDEADAQMLATQVSVVLANARAYWEAFDLAQGLRQALESRAVIEQAKGKIMGANGCDANAAFALLVKASQRENVKLRDVARRVVEGNTGSTPAP